MKIIKRVYRKKGVSKSSRAGFSSGPLSTRVLDEEGIALDEAATTNTHKSNPKQPPSAPNKQTNKKHHQCVSLKHIEITAVRKHTAKEAERCGENTLRSCRRLWQKDPKFALSAGLTLQHFCSLCLTGSRLSK